MGRQLYRVPMGFDWPFKKVWHGYVNPHYRPCPRCDGGRTASLNAFETIVRRLMLAGADSCSGRPMHPYMREMGIADVGDSLHEVTSGLAGRKPDGPFGHDSIDSWKASKAILAAAGLPESWGVCTHCGGEAIDPAVRKEYDAWKPFEPPAGEGFQLWETTSEGSPASPVFETLDALCQWCERNATTFADYRATAAEWQKMLGDGLVTATDGRNVFI